MKLLFDQNLSPRLVSRIADLFPGSEQVSMAGLVRATDTEVWAYARANDYVIVTKDADFADIGLVQGFPPKVLWLRLGNCTTQQIEDVLRRHQAALIGLDIDASLGVLALS